MTDNLNPVHFYQTADGGHFSASLTTPHTRKDGKAPKTEPRPIKWLPLAENGEDAVTYTRRTIPAATFTAYMVETDSEKRDAILASCPVTANEDGTPRLFESPIGLTIPQAKIARALVSREQLEAMNAAGLFARPTDRAERAAGTASAKRTMTEAERNSAALDALFALADEETAPEDSTDATGDTAPEDSTDDGTDDADDESTDESDEKIAD